MSRKKYASSSRRITVPTPRKTTPISISAMPTLYASLVRLAVALELGEQPVQVKLSGHLPAPNVTKLRGRRQPSKVILSAFSARLLVSTTKVLNMLSKFSDK